MNRDQNKLKWLRKKKVQELAPQVILNQSDENGLRQLLNIRFVSIEKFQDISQNLMTILMFFKDVKLQGFQGQLTLF